MKNEYWATVKNLHKTGDVLARSELCHLHDEREDAETCGLGTSRNDRKRDVVLVRPTKAGSRVWIVLRSLSEVMNGRLAARPPAPDRAGGRTRAASQAATLGHGADHP